VIVYPGVYEASSTSTGHRAQESTGRDVALCAQRRAYRLPRTLSAVALDRLATVKVSPNFLADLPADGWLRHIAVHELYGHDWFDEDHILVDSCGPP